jgi:protease I
MQMQKEETMELKDRTVAMLVGPGTAVDELNQVHRVLSDAGAEVLLVGPTLEDIEPRMPGRGRPISVGMGIGVAKQVWFDAVVIPGGENIEAYRGNEQVYDFLGAFDIAAKPIAAIGRGVLLLADVDLLDGRRVAVKPELAEAVKAAGAEVAPCDFCLDRPLYTACGPEGIPALLDALSVALERLQLPAKAMASPAPD